MSAELWIIFAFGLAFLGIRMAIAFYLPHPSPDQEAVFRTTLSLAAAGIAAAIPGTFHFESHVATTTISATGALAVFAIVYLINPASLRRGSDATTNRPTSDDTHPPLGGSKDASRISKKARQTIQSNPSHASTLSPPSRSEVENALDRIATRRAFVVSWAMTPIWIVIQVVSYQRRSLVLFSLHLALTLVVLFIADRLCSLISPETSPRSRTAQAVIIGELLYFLIEGVAFATIG